MSKKNMNNVKLTVEFSEATTRANINSKENISTLFGKIKKVITDLHSSAFTGNAAKVNGHTVESDVPVNAKFTDTTYNEATTATPGIMSADDKKSLDLLDNPLGVCDTPRATMAKVVTLDNFKLTVGKVIAVTFTNTAFAAPTSGNMTLNVNDTGAKTVYFYYQAGNRQSMSYSQSSYFYNNRTHLFVYDGSYWICLTYNYYVNNTYSTFTKSGSSASSGLVPEPPTTEGTTKYLREDCTWAEIPESSGGSDDKLPLTGGVVTGNVQQSGPTTDYNTYKFRNISFGTSATPVSDATYGGNGSIYFYYK